MILERILTSPEARRRKELEDTYGLLNLSPSLPRIRQVPFQQRLRNLPQCPRYHSLFYVWWTLFLVFFYVARVLLGWYMTTATFGATKGIPLTLPPSAITSQSLQSFADGVPIADEHGAVFLDPGRDRLYVLDLRADGAMLLDGESVGRPDLVPRLLLLQPEDSEVHAHVVVRVEADASFQQFAEVLDVVAGFSRASPAGTLGVWTARCD